MEKESPGLSFSNAASIWLQQWAEKSRHKVISKLGHPMILLVMILLLWSFLKSRNTEPPDRSPSIEIDTSLKVETSCDGKTKVSGVLLSSSDLLCVLLPSIEFNCIEKSIVIKSSQMSQLPLNKWNLLKNTRFVEKIPSGAESCKNIKKIYYESW